MADGSKLGIDKIRAAIADILETEQLDSLTSRIVRNKLEQNFSVGLKDRKKEIDELLMSMIEEKEERSNTNGTAEEEESDDQDIESEDDEPSPKKEKTAKSLVPKNPDKKKQATKPKSEDDAEVARQLQESETGLRKRKHVTKRAPMARSDVVKKMWQIIKERNLTDPKDKRFHICDDELMKVFGKKRVQTFSMMKYLKQHISDPELLI